MGADIYLRKISDQVQARYQPAFEAAVVERNALEQGTPEYAAAQQRVNAAYELTYSEGYFRDSYNATNMLNQFGLSWWQDVGALLDDEGNLSPVHCRKLLAMMDERQPVFEEAMRDIADGRRNGDDVSTWERLDPRNNWVEYFEGKAVEFRVLLRQAIEIDEPLYCSI